MSVSHNTHRKHRGRRILAWPMTVLWLLSTLAQAGNCCFPEARFVADGNHGVSPGSHEPAHSHRPFALPVVEAVAVYCSDDGTPAHDTEPGCSEIKQPAASILAKWAGYAASDPDQTGWVGPEAGLGWPGGVALAVPIRPVSVPPPSLNPFLSTIRLLL